MGKQLLSSLVGGGGLILGFSLLTSAMQFATLGLSAFTRGGFGAKKATAEMKDEVFQFAKVLDDVARQLSKDAARVNELFAALNSGKVNFNERKAALKELKNINKDYFGSLKDEDGVIKGLQAAYDGYLQRIVQIGKAKAIQTQLTKLFDKKLELQLSVDTGFISAIDPNVAAEAGRLRKELEALGGPVDRATEKFDAFNKTQAERLRLQQRIHQLESGGALKFLPGVAQGVQRQIDRIDLQINALSKMFGDIGEFDIPTPDDSDAEKAMDRIIARARLFVKEFGDVFIVPDLEESFFRNKAAVFADAQKLLDDVSKGNLKIRLFVLPEIEVPDVKLPEFDADGKMRESILEGMRKEFQESFVPDISIDVAAFNENIKTQFEKALDQGNFKQALDLVDVNTSNLMFDGLDERVRNSALLINDTLTPAFEGLFDAILKGENPIKAFFNSIIQSINQVIKRLIAAAIQAAILSAISGGTTSFGSAFSRLFGIGGSANFGNRVAFAGAGGSQANINVRGVLRGTDIYLSGIAGGRSIGRAGG
jgi:hypothetical protein